MKNIENKLDSSSKSIVIVGAGKIGRSFIGQLFGSSGYELVFIDNDVELVNLLNERKFYAIVIKGVKEEILKIHNVRAVSADDKTRVSEEIARTSIMAVSVGIQALHKVIPLIAKGLEVRYQLYKHLPLDIIIAENMRSAPEFFRKQLSSYLPAAYPINKLVGLVEASIGKMAPLIRESDIKKDPLLVFAEPYNNLILDKKGFKGAVPVVKGLSLKENIKAWVDRKIFIHNLGHATVAYYGSYYHKNATFIYEVLEDKKVFTFAKEVMLQAAKILEVIYPTDFSLNDLIEHIDDLLLRFRNKALGDTIFRVGKDLPRKLGSEDRFMGILRLAENYNMGYDKILESMVYAFYFSACDDQGKMFPADIGFLNKISEGLELTLTSVCGFDPVKDKKIILKFIDIYTKLKNV